MNTQHELHLTHLGHSCVLITVRDAGDPMTILIDPGNLGVDLTNVGAVDAVFVTHLHEDHCDPAQLDKLTFTGDPKVFGPEGSSAVLGTRAKELSAGPIDFDGFAVEMLDAQHETIYQGVPLPPSLGYLIDRRILAPGDSFLEADGPVDVLLVPLGAPWMKLSETIDYVNAVTPRVAIPVHDAGLAPAHRALHRNLLTKFAPAGTTVIIPGIGERVTLR